MSREAPAVLIGVENLGSLHHKESGRFLPESSLAAGPLGEEVDGILSLLCLSLAGTLLSCPTPELSPKSFPACVVKRCKTLLSAFLIPGPLAWSCHSLVTCPWVTVFLHAQCVLPPPFPGCNFCQGPTAPALCSLFPSGATAQHLVKLVKELPHGKGYFKQL